ncbi:hypothetical protein GC56T3_0361 [Geobacillus sp. C56-T3]|nr:hypothetical protein GC56T3_0361 [Geobacillus sp. C56-T3]
MNNKKIGIIVCLAGLLTIISASSDKISKHTHIPQSYIIYFNIFCYLVLFIFLYIIKRSMN